MRDSKERFTDRVDDYVKYRPDYPAEVVDVLRRECGLEAGRVVADVGSGTGILTARLLTSGARVLGVEPNAAMRAAAERALAGEPRFASVDGSAEATGLPDASVDLVTAAQAFHWFDARRAKAELARILRAPRWAAVVWNLRKSTPFNDAYDAMLEEHAPEYPAVRARDRVATSGMDAFFAPRRAHSVTLPKAQRLDAQGLRGRLQSSSYAPKPGAPGHDAIAEGLDRLFETHARGGLVEIAYDTVVFWGTLDG